MIDHDIQRDEAQSGGSEHRETVQILVGNDGNRTAIASLLEDRYETETAQSIRDADLYLVEDRVFARYSEALRARVEASQPVFCPVVLIRSEATNVNVALPGVDDREEPLLVDDVVEAPITSNAIHRRLESLLVRRRQSAELKDQVSELERRERDLQRFERAVEESGHAVYITDSDGTIEYVNPAFEAMTGYSREAILGETPRQLRADSYADVFERAVEAPLSSDAVRENETVNERPDGSRYVVDETVATITGDDGTVDGVVTVMTDITERTRREQALRDREQELDLLRQILSRVLRHNIRNALTVIRGHTENLRRAVPASSVESVDKILEQVETLEAVSDTAHTYSTLVDSDDSVVTYDIESIVEQVVDDAREQYPDVTFDTDVDGSPSVRANQGVERAVRELVENAAKHNDEEVPRVRLTVRSGATVRLVVEDNGPGIPGRELASLRNMQETALTHSTGIGLWLSKWVLEHSGAELSFDVTGSGTRIEVEFSGTAANEAAPVEVPDLKRRERKLQATLDRMTDAFVEIDEDWQVTDLDTRAERILDVDAARSCGRSVHHLFETTLEEWSEAAYWEVMETREPTSFAEYYEALDRWLEVQVYPDPDGGLSVYFRDITERKQRQQELSRFKRAVEAASQAIYMTEPDGTITYVNPAFEELSGFERSELVGETPNIVNSGQQDVGFFDELWETIKTGERWEGEVINQSRDGAQYTAYETISPVTDADGELDRFVAFQTDITHRKKRERDLEQYQTIIEALNDGVYALDENGRFTYVNEAFVDMVGYTEDRILGSDPSLIKDADAVATAERNLARLLSSDGPDTDTFRLEIQPRDGEPIPCEDHMGVLPYEGDRFEGSVGTLRDISERDDRIRDIELINRIMRHDVRNALQVVLGRATVLDDHLDGEGSRHLRTIRDNTERAIELTSTARDLSELLLETETGTTNTAVSVRSICERELAEIRASYPDAVVTVDGSIPSVSVIADDMLGSAVRNLLQNAIVHNDEGTPEVELSVTEQADDTAIRVADNGPGIPDEQRSDLFGKGETGLESEGTGIGLYLVATLAERYGGSVQLRKGDSGGATFELRLPKAET